jgi:hypothetical protein
VALNKGLVGFGSNDSRGIMDNIAVQTAPLGNTLDTNKYFEDGLPEQFTGPTNGVWTQSGGRLSSIAAANAYTVDTVDLGVTINPISATTVDATLNTTGIGGIAFDAYAVNDFKFAALDIAGQRIVVGHVDPTRGWVVETSYAAALVAGTNYVLDVVLKGTVATVSLNGNVLGSWTYNASVVDGKVGTLSRSGTASFDRFEIKTNDAAFTGSPPQPPELRIGDVSANEGNSATSAVTLTLSLTSPATTATTIGYKTIAGNATSGSDFTGVTSGTATIAAGATSALITVYVIGDTTFEPNETFTVQVTSASGLNLADGFATVSIVNDDLQPKLSAGSATVTEGNSGTATLNIPVTLSNASSSTITVVVTTVAGTAKAPGDFISTTATLTFAPGATTANFSVPIVGDTVAEPTETFTLVLSSPTGATIATGTGTVMIIDNDGALFAAETAPARAATGPALSESALAPVVVLAKSLWRAALPGADFGGITFTIGDLAGDLLGFTLGKSITIDPTAAGWGWSVTSPGSAASRMDLLSVVLHELGLALGFREDDPAEPWVMARTLAAGVQTPPRLLPLLGSAPTATGAAGLVRIVSPSVGSVALGSIASESGLVVLPAARHRIAVFGSVVRKLTIPKSAFRPVGKVRGKAAHRGRGGVKA